MANRGRPKGSGNKPLSRVLSERLSERFPDYDPVMELVAATIRIKDIATESNDIQDYKSLVDSLEKASRFIQPQLKSIEVQTDSSLTVKVMKKRFDGSKSSGTGDDDS
tara:strand:- start:24 stop:347 length:324 start_codon:yes stop_codon:yes gene_type:complete